MLIDSKTVQSKDAASEKRPITWENANPVQRASAWFFLRRSCAYPTALDRLVEFGVPKQALFEAGSKCKGGFDSCLRALHHMEPALAEKLVKEILTVDGFAEAIRDDASNTSFLLEMALLRRLKPGELTQDGYFSEMRETRAGTKGEEWLLRIFPKQIRHHIPLESVAGIAAEPAKKSEEEPHGWGLLARDDNPIQKHIDERMLDSLVNNKIATKEELIKLYWKDRKKFAELCSAIFSGGTDRLEKIASYLTPESLGWALQDHLDETVALITSAASSNLWSKEQFVSYVFTGKFYYGFMGDKYRKWFLETFAEQIKDVKIAVEKKAEPELPGWDKLMNSLIDTHSQTLGHFVKIGIATKESLIKLHSENEELFVGLYRMAEELGFERLDTIVGYLGKERFARALEKRPDAVVYGILSGSRWIELGSRDAFITRICAKLKEDDDLMMKFGRKTSFLQSFADSFDVGREVGWQKLRGQCKPSEKALDLLIITGVFTKEQLLNYLDSHPANCFNDVFLLALTTDRIGEEKAEKVFEFLGKKRFADAFFEHPSDAKILLDACVGAPVGSKAEFTAFVWKRLKETDWSFAEAAHWTEDYWAEYYQDWINKAFPGLFEKEKARPVSVQPVDLKLKITRVPETQMGPEQQRLLMEANADLERFSTVKSKMARLKDGWLAEHGDHWFLWKKLAGFCEESSDLPAAEMALNSALTHNPNFPAALLQRAGIRSRMGKKEDALVDLDLYLQFRPGEKEGWLAKAKLLESDGKVVNAFGTLEQGLANIEGDEAKKELEVGIKRLMRMALEHGALIRCTTGVEESMQRLRVGKRDIRIAIMDGSTHRHDKGEQRHPGGVYSTQHGDLSLIIAPHLADGYIQVLKAYKKKGEGEWKAS